MPDKSRFDQPTIGIHSSSRLKENRWVSKVKLRRLLSCGVRRCSGMSDLFSEPKGDNAPAMTVSEISGAIRRTLESRFDHVRVRGELSGLKRAASGHLYLSLKDDKAVINAICWRGSLAKLSIQPQDGLEVICTGRVSSYPGRSNYQLIIDSMELAGQGALLKLLEQRRQTLTQEGLFAAERKKSLPLLPEVIGVVTSPTGAVLRDILHRLRARFPRRVVVWPTLVQGEGAAAQVAAAIRGFNALPVAGGAVPRPDLLIVARGGGSLEDLWAFNEEAVVRAAADSVIPLISAVGHETDTTLIDFAADRRAPTPTAAAEMAVPVRTELISAVWDLDNRRDRAVRRLTRERGLQLDLLARGLPDLRRLVEDKAQRLDDEVTRLTQTMQLCLRLRGGDLRELGARLPHPRQQITLAAQQSTALSDRLHRAGRSVLSAPRQKIDLLTPQLTAVLSRSVERASGELCALARVLESVSYKNVLGRGFAVVRSPDGVILTAKDLAPQQRFMIEFAGDKKIPAECTPTGQKPEQSKPDRPKRAGKVTAQKNTQTSLFEEEDG